MLVLREVLRWRAEEVAGLLDTTVPAVNSALQRARATLAGHEGKARPGEVDADQAELLAAYVDAFQRYDMAAFVRLLHDDAVQDMPPFAMWLRSASDVVAWMEGPVGCRGSALLPVDLNGSTAFAQWKPDGAGGWTRFAIQALEVHDGRISRITSFLDTRCSTSSAAWHAPADALPGRETVRLDFRPHPAEDDGAGHGDPVGCWRNS